MSGLRSSPHKRSATRQSEERKDAKRHKAGSTSPPNDPPPLSSSSQLNTIPALDIILLEKYIKNAIQKVRTSLKPFLKHKDYPVCVIRNLDMKIRERIHLAIRDKVIDSDAEVFRLYSALYNTSSDLELLRSVLHEYDEIIKRQAMVNNISKVAKLTDTKPLPYSDDMANSLSNESIFTEVKSLADEVMTQAAQRQILTELYEADNNIQHLPKSCIDEFTEMIRSTLNSLDKRDSDWHWTKIYELYRRDYSMESDKQQLLDICKEQGFKIPRSSPPSEHLYLDIKPPKPIRSATNIIVNDLKMSVDRSSELERMNRRWKMACVDVNSSLTCLFKHYMGCIIKRLVGDKYFTIKPNTRTNVLVLTYRQYRCVDDDVQLFKKFENDFIERTKRDTSSKELVSELHFWRNDNLTSKCFFDMVKITLSKIIGHVLLQYQDASLYHINYLIYEIRSELLTLKYMRNENKWALTYSEILVEFQNYSESKLNFYIERYMCIKTNNADSNNTIEEEKPVNSYCNPKHEGLRQVVCKMLKEKLDSIFDKGMKIDKEGLKSENGDIKTPKQPGTADEMQSGASGHGNNTIYGSVTAKRERHVESQVENILNTSIINEMTQFKNIKMEQTAIHRNHDSSQSQAGSIVEGFKSAVTKQILCTENSSLISPGGTRIGLIKSEPKYEETQTKDGNEPGILNDEIASNIKYNIFLPMQVMASSIDHEQITQNKNVAEIVLQKNFESTNQCENMTETQKQDNIITNMKSESIAEDDEMEDDIFLPMQEITSNIKHEQIPQVKEMAEIVRQENVEYGNKDDTLLPFSSARNVNEPSIVNQEIALYIATNRCENMTETQKQVNIVTNMKSEPIVEDDEMENEFVLPMESETVNQVMSLNIKHELITQNGNVTDAFEQNNFKHEVKNDILPLSSVGEINTPEECLPSTHNKITSIKTEIINPDDEQDISIETNEINACNTMELLNTFFTKFERELEPEGNCLSTLKQEDVSAEDLKNVAVGNVDADASISQMLSRNTNIALGEEETWKSTNYSSHATVIHNIVDEYLSSAIPELKEKLMSTILKDNILLNNFDKQLQKTYSQLIRLTGEPRLPLIVTLLQFLKQFNIESIKMRKNFHHTIYVQTSDWKIVLQKNFESTNQCENMTETQKQDNIITNMKSESIAEDDEMEDDIFLPMQEITSNIKHEQIPQVKEMAEIVRQENVEYGNKDDTLLPFSSARNVNEPSIVNQEIALYIATNRCENMTETQKQVNIVTNMKSEPIVEDDEMENEFFLPMESETVNQVMSLNIKHELITQNGNVTDAFEQNNFKHEVKNDILPLSSVGEINTPEECLPSTHNKITSIKTEIINPDDEQDISIETNEINACNTMELLNTFFTKFERELEPEGNCLSTLKQEDVSAEDLKNVAVGNVDADASISQMLSRNTNIALGEEETWKSTNYSSHATVIHNIVDEYLSSAIPELKEKLMSTILKDNILLNNFDKQLQKTYSQLIRLTGEPRLPSIVTLLQFLKQFNIESIKMRKNFHHTIYVQTSDWSKLLEIGEVDLDGKKLFIQKEIYCKQLVNVYIDPDAIFLIKSIDKWNKELVDQASQTYTRIVVRKRKPTAANGDGPVENEVAFMTNNSDTVTVTDSTVALIEPTKNNITGIGNGTTKKKRNKRKKRIRKTKIYIHEDEEEMEQLPGYPSEYKESRHEVNIEDDFDKIINDLDPEVESFLTTIKETANLPESENA